MDEPTADWAPYWMQKPLYAYVEHREETRFSDNRFGVTLTLDLVPRDSIQPFMGRPAANRSEIFKLPCALASVTARDDEAADLKEVEEGSWHSARLALDEKLPATLFRDLDADTGSQAVRATLNPLSQQEQQRLLELVSLEDAPIATAQDLVTLLRPTAVAEFIDVVNVGQGNCNPLCNSNGSPIMYFDLGAGCLGNSKTRPANLRFCFTDHPDVLLSHWDFDHWFAATLQPQAMEVRWLAPLQSVGLRTRKFAQRLMQDGRLRLWGPGPGLYRNNRVDVMKCAGRSKNDSGLALALNLAKGAFLCPADAAYDYIPFKGQPLAGLVATHHGTAKMGEPVPPPATSKAKLAFSYGTGNTFGHPQLSLATYFEHGWKNMRYTPEGSIALGRPPGLAPCNGTMCSISTTQ